MSLSVMQVSIYQYNYIMSSQLKLSIQPLQTAGLSHAMLNLQSKLLQSIRIWLTLRHP